jgi:hypothetical protein
MTVRIEWNEGLVDVGREWVAYSEAAAAALR